MLAINPLEGITYTSNLFYCIYGLEYAAAINTADNSAIMGANDFFAKRPLVIKTH